MTGDGVRCLLMRGGTSKGLYFLAGDLPADPGERDALLLAVMGSGHPMQVDGVGGAHPLASKIAVVSPSAREDADIDYLFLQLGVRIVGDRIVRYARERTLGVGHCRLDVAGLVANRR